MVCWPLAWLACLALPKLRTELPEFCHQGRCGHRGAAQGIFGVQRHGVGRQPTGTARGRWSGAQRHAAAGAEERGGIPQTKRSNPRQKDTLSQSLIIARAWIRPTMKISCDSLSTWMINGGIEVHESRSARDITSVRLCRLQDGPQLLTMIIALFGSPPTQMMGPNRHTLFGPGTPNCAASDLQNSSLARRVACK